MLTSFLGPDGPSVELRKFVTARAISLTSHLKNLSKALDRFKQIGNLIFLHFLKNLEIIKCPMFY